MVEPTKKSKAIENLIDDLNPLGLKRKETIKTNKCTWCGSPILDFKDELSKKEYSISGMCQNCQDKTFN